jgi:aminoglycoside phosphotransferase (APT) family kinase protein
VTEQPLPGGFVADVVRVDDTVRRPPATSFVHRLLDHLADWPGAPRFLGMDEQGREILSFVDGYVPWQSPLRSPESLIDVARMVREFHDRTAGTELPGDEEVVCHNDLSPKNTVYRDERPIAFIDWDIAAPGARIHDVAHVCWQYLGLGPDVTDIAETAHMVRLICDAYGAIDRTRLVDTILWWQDRCWRGIESAAAAGHPAMIRLRDADVPTQVRAAHAWTAQHRATLDAALR